MQDGGIVKHQCFGEVSSATEPNYQVIHEYFSIDTSSEDVWIDFAHFNNHKSSLS